MTTKPRNISLDAWVAQEKTRIDEFAAHWRASQASLPWGTKKVDWPDRQPAGEWDDQYRLWGES